MRILLGILILLVGLVVASSHFIVVFIFEPRLEAHRQRFNRMTSKILADLEMLNQNPPFEDLSFERDAQVAIDPYISWEGISSSDSADRVRDLLLRYAYWRSAPGQLKQLTEDPDFKSIDTEWVNELYKYDHWNLPSKPEHGARLRQLGELNGLDRMAAWAKIPLPNYKDLREWATLNFLRKQKAGQGLAGLHSYRKVSQLIHSSGTLVGNAVAAAMLRDEVFLMEHFKVSGWVSTPMEVIEAYRRISWAWSGLARMPWFGELPSQFKPYLKTKFGLCAVAFETSAGIPGLQDFLEPRVLFETNYTPAVGRVRAFQNQVLSECHLAEFASIFAATIPASNGLFHQRPADALFVAAPVSIPLGPLNYTRIPYLRRILGMILMTVAVPDFFRLYDQAPPPED